MSKADREKWDEKYVGTRVEPVVRPPDWLLAHLEILPLGRALDVATGHGHSAIELAWRGYAVTAIDISQVGIRIAAQSAARAGVTIDWVVADLDEFSLPPDRFDVITCFQYLERRRLPSEIMRSLRAGGMLLFETFTVDQLRVPNNHLKNPDHLLRPGELLALFPGLRVRAYRDVRLPDRALASLLAEKV